MITNVHLSQHSPQWKQQSQFLHSGIAAIAHGAAPPHSKPYDHHHIIVGTLADIIVADDRSPEMSTTTTTPPHKTAPSGYSSSSPSLWPSAAG
ncbi:hypothetical protein BKD75_01270 [Corynebacterium diphtheriae]|nr:hypothetical protein [Corynebacterium diphtheriae]OJI03901.1 hypothetical protein BKD75_01270 [Corynebacterium diphtheriae]